MHIRDHGRYAYSAIVDRPVYAWPGGKSLAFYVALNVEHFSFGEGLGHTPTAPGPMPDVRNYAWRDYGLRVGIWRVFDLAEKLGLPLVHLLNGAVAERFEPIVRRIRERGDEVVGHGFTNSERQSDMQGAEEAEMIEKVTDLLARHCGQRPFGWMGPWIAETSQTPDLLKEAGYRYIMDWPADDQPFWMSTRAGPILSVPYPIEINDSPTMLSRAQSATDFRQMIVDQFETMLALSREQPLVCGISLHTFCVGQPFRLTQLQQALAHICSHPSFGQQVWVTTPGRIADYVAGLPNGMVLGST